MASVTTGTELVGRTLVGERMVTWLLVAFGVLALGLACLGVYGLIAYLVVQRTAEIGLRIALGARRPQLLWLLLRRSLFWIGAGIALGVLAGAGRGVWCRHAGVRCQSDGSGDVARCGARHGGDGNPCGADPVAPGLECGPAGSLARRVTADGTGKRRVGHEW